MPFFWMGGLTVLLLASCVFYMAWNPAYLFLIVMSITVDYVAGLRMDSAPNHNVRRAWLAASLTVNMGLLGLFKYYNFFAGTIVDVGSLFGAQLNSIAIDVLLPVGQLGV